MFKIIRFNGVDVLVLFENISFSLFPSFFFSQIRYLGNEPLLDKKVCKEYEKARADFKSNQSKKSNNESKKSKAKDVFEFDDDEEPIKDDSKDDSKDSEAKKDDTETENNDDKETPETDQDEPEEIIEVEPDETGEFDILKKAEILDKAHRKEKATKADKIMEKLLFSKKKDGRRASVSIAQPQISLQQMEQMAKGNFFNRLSFCKGQ